MTKQRKEAFQERQDIGTDTQRETEAPASKTEMRERPFVPIPELEL